MSAGRRISFFLPSLAGGGAERVCVELANEFASRSLGIDLVLATAEGPYLREVSRDVRVVDLGAPRMLRALPPLVRYLRSERPATLLSALDHANIAAILAVVLAGSGTRCVISIRAMPTAVYGGARSAASRAVFWLMKRTYRFADAIVANSHAVAADLARVLELPAERIVVVHNPLNLARIAKESAEDPGHAWPAERSIPIVLGVGSLTPIKGFTALVEAFAIVRRRRPCRLVILGEGPERAALESLVRERGLSSDVLLPGFTANPFAWMRRARVFASSSRTEGCPNALMQALAIGVPIVSTDDSGGSAEILEQGRWGRLVPVGRPDAMADAIESSLDAAPPDGFQDRAAQFSHERIARLFLSILLPRENAA
jgi:glycosyltransferase involved in cell wall biosynthesis